MSSKITIHDNHKEISAELDKNAAAFLYEAVSTIEAGAIRNSPVDTGDLKNSWEYVVDDEALEAFVGNSKEYAVYQELGTGIYASEGNGRKTPWFYKDPSGKGHITRGNKAKHMLENSFLEKSDKIIARAQEMYSK